MKIIKASKIKYIPASHEDPEDPGVLKKILVERKDIAKGSMQMINWAKLLSNKSFEPHYHEDMQEIFIILSGKATIIINDETEILEKGDAAIVPIKSTHLMKNEANKDVEYMVIGIATGEGGKTVNV